MAKICKQGMCVLFVVMIERIMKSTHFLHKVLPWNQEGTSRCSHQHGLQSKRHHWHSWPGRTHFRCTHLIHEDRFSKLISTDISKHMYAHDFIVCLNFPYSVTRYTKIIGSFFVVSSIVFSYVSTAVFKVIIYPKKNSTSCIRDQNDHFTL